MLDLSLILPLRNAEHTVASMVRQAAAVARDLDGVGQLSSPVRFEVLTLDERSGDNTLSTLSLLHGQVPELRTLQDLEPGSAISRSTRVAAGRIWAIVDKPIEASLLRWALSQVACGHRAALVPGELLVVERELALVSLSRMRGGLVRAQHLVERELRRRGERPAFSPRPEEGRASAARFRVRKALAELGFGRLDRPPRGSSA